MTSKLKLIINIALFILIVSSCNNEEFKQTDTNIFYKFIEENTDSTKVKENDILILKLIYANEKGDIIFDSRELGKDYKMIIKKPDYIGSIEEAILMMHISDSAIFKVDAADFYMLSRKYSTLPDEVKNGGKLVFYVKVLGITNTKDVNNEKTTLNEKQQILEKDLLADFLYKENIKIAPTKSGLYYNEKIKGKGKMPKNGDKVIIHYTGKFINGEIFDSSVKINKPLEYIFGENNFILGWTESISYMREGGVAQLIIPSKLAYGDKRNGIIPPNTTLIFEVELLKVVPQKTK